MSRTPKKRTDAEAAATPRKECNRKQLERVLKEMLAGGKPDLSSSRKVPEAPRLPRRKKSPKS